MPRERLPGPIVAASADARPAVADRGFGLIVGLGFLVVAGYLTAHHEPWRDEMQAWLLARDSPTFGMLVRHMRYEGHPLLWQLLLFVPQRTVGATPATMQALNVFFAAAAVTTFAAFAPFSRGQRVLFAMGFFPLYMYGTLARDYALTLLCVFASVALVPRRRERAAALAVVLLVLCWTTVFGLILALAFLAALLPDASEARWPRAWGILVVAGAVFSARQMQPPPDSGYAAGWHFGLESERLRQVLLSAGNAVFPLEAPGRTFGEPPWFRSHSGRSRWLGGAAACAALIWAGVAARRKPIALRFHLVAVAGLLGFLYAKHIGAIMHHGFILVALLCTLWLASERADPPRFVLTGLLLVQAVAGVVPALRDTREVFSYGREVAVFLQRQHLDGNPLVGYPDAAMATVLGFLPGRTAFFPGPDRQGTFTIWDQARLREPADREIVAKAESLAIRGGRPAILVVTHAVDHPMAEPLATFVGGYVGPDEDFYVYRVSPVHAGAERDSR